MNRAKWIWLPWCLAGACAATRSEPPGLGRVATDLEAFIDRHLREQGIPGIWVAVLDVDPASGREALWASGCTIGPVSAAEGGQHLESIAARRNAEPRAVHRVASISKLFTATAAMVLVERGQLDLDVPVATYLPEFAPQNPFDGPVTLRMLLGHRGGIVRESPIGHYFDASEPTLAATVASLNETSLVFPPGSAFKYSNPGMGVVGEVVARVTGKPFEAAVRELVLEPLGLRDSDFAARDDLERRQPGAVMWTYDGRAIPVASFAFGYAPAANLRSTTVDLVHFARSWFPNSTARVLRPETLEAMWRLPAGDERGCGISYFVQPFSGHRQVGHDGAVYGFASSLRALPDAGLAVAVVCTKDFSNDVAEAIAERALAAALANRRGEALPAPVFPVPLGVERARALAGTWVCGKNWVQLCERGGDLYYDPNIGVRTRLRLAADGTFVSDDPLSIGNRRLRELPDGTLHDGEVTYLRDLAVPAAPPADLLPLLGEYGFDHNVLVVYEDRGRLGVLIEWLVHDLPDREGPDRYRFPPGMYGGDQLRFERAANGEVAAAIVGGARMPRRPAPPRGGFRVVPVRPIPVLMAEAARGSPPTVAAERPFDLVDLRTLEPTLEFDIRYATADNFLGTAVYAAPVARLQRPAAEALVRVHRALAAQGLGLRVFDGYRPWAVTKVFFEAVPPALRHFVADPAAGSRHNRGCAVDLTLFDLVTGQPVAMPSDFDEFTALAHPDYSGGTSQQRYHREVLRRAMAAEGFAVDQHEWWHFDHPDWVRYPLGNEPL